MFTGLVEWIGVVESNSGSRLNVRTPGFRIKAGGSLSVNGACLSMIEKRRRRLSFDIGPETRRATNLGFLRRGSRVNLERPLRVGSELGGHLVSGHVDGLAKILAREILPDGFFRLRVESPRIFRSLIAPKGSIALDGVSLTVVAVGGAYFEVIIVPATLERTTLGSCRAGQALNLEVDLLARYVHSVLSERRT